MTTFAAMVVTPLIELFSTVGAHPFVTPAG